MAKSTAGNVARLAAAAMESVAQDAEAAADSSAEMGADETGEEQRGRQPYARIDRQRASDGEWGRLPVRLDVGQINEEYIFKRFGAGKYQVHEFAPGKTGKMMIARRHIMNVEDPAPMGSAPAAAMTIPSGDLNVQLHQQMLEQSRQSAAQMASIIAQSQESHAAMLALLLRPAPPPPAPPDTMAGIAAMIGAFAPILANMMPARVAPTDPAETAAKLLAVFRESQPAKSNTADFVEMLKLAQQMASGRPIGDEEDAEPGSEWLSVLKATAPAVTAIAQAAMNRPTPPPIPAVVPVPQLANPVPIVPGRREDILPIPDPTAAGLDLLDAVIPTLGQVAVTKRPGSHRDLSRWLLDTLTPAQAEQILQAAADPNAVAMLGQRYPVVRENRAWFMALVDELRASSKPQD